MHSQQGLNAALYPLRTVRYHYYVCWGKKIIGIDWESHLKILQFILHHLNVALLVNSG